VAVAILGITAAAAAGCGSNTLAPDIDWELVVGIGEGSNRPRVGDITQMTATIARAGKTGTEPDAVNISHLVTWSVMGQPGIVSINATGSVTALAPGAVGIVAAYGGKTGSQSLIIE
jgi:hypothetical protein